MIELHVDKLVGGNIVITTEGSTPVNSGYDVTFNLGGMPPSGNYSNYNIPSYWNDGYNVEIWFSNGNSR